jgi:pilus assembly protein FimV
MSSGKNPLMLMMALSMPGAAHALGLGDIHVDSALNERLAAEIDIIGATALELADLRAAVANHETFLRYGADRPAFLSSATFKVTQDSHGRPVLAVRSTESFTEPVVNFLVDLQWRNGQLVRQYTLLLDPAGFASAPPAAPSEVPAPVAMPSIETPVRAASRVDPPAEQPNPITVPAVRKTTHIKVGAKATLRGVAWRVGERSESDLQRMMLAIFRANPSAFDGNINRLHRGALLTIPAHAELTAISKAEAKREIRAQMAAWHAPVRAVATNNATPVADTPVADTPVADTPADAAISSPAVEKVSDVSAAAALSHRVQSLEQELSEMKGLLERGNDQMLALQQLAIRTETPAPIVEAVRAARPSSRYGALVRLVAGLGLLAAALAALYFRFRRRAATVNESRSVGVAGAADATADAALDSPIAAHEPTPDRAQEHQSGNNQADADATQPQLPILPAIEPLRSSAIAASPFSRAAAHDTTVNVRADTVNLRMDPTRLDYNLLDLDLTAQHVQMPSVLNEQVVMKERRTNLADVLRLAIEREPDRHDLRMKLLELYYSAAATNRKAFLDVVQKFARERDHLQSDQWDKIAFMGRQIASENSLFAEESADDDDLANCA